MVIELRRISIFDDNMKECIELDIEEHQRGYVAANSISLAQAYDKNLKGETARPYAIYADDKMVGFVMYGFFTKEEDGTDEDQYYFWRLMIDKNHQGKGYGKQAMNKIIEDIKTFPLGPSETLTTSYEMSEVGPRKFYESLGFKATGEIMGEGVDAEAITILNF
jgi:diamine N-acetyltransferase